MIQHVVYCQLEDELEKTTLEELVRWSRTLLLKIPEVLSVYSGRNIDPASKWQFFFSFQTDSLEKLKMALDDAYYLKLMEHYVQPNARDFMSFDYELDPSKDLKYS